MFADKSEQLLLHYGKHHITLVDEMKMWFEDEAFTDVVIVCDDDCLFDTRPPEIEPPAKGKIPFLKKWVVKF